MASTLVDPDRASGNFQLHCKSGTFSTFILILFVDNISGYLSSWGNIGACRVSARDEQRQLIRVIPQGHLEDSTVRRLFQENPDLQMEHPRNQQTHFNPNDQGLLGDPQRPYEPPRQGNGVASLATPVAGGGNINFQKNQYRAPPAPLPNVERTLREIMQP